MTDLTAELHHTRHIFSGAMGWPVLQPKDLAELRHVHDDAIGANAIGRVRIDADCHAQHLGPLRGTPVLRPAEKQLLLRRVAGRRFLIQ